MRNPDLFEAVYHGVQSALKAARHAPAADPVDAAISRAQDAIGASRLAVDRAAAHSPVRRFNPQKHDPFVAQPGQVAVETRRRQQQLHNEAVDEELGPHGVWEWFPVNLPWHLAPWEFPNRDMGADLEARDMQIVPPYRAIPSGQPHYRMDPDGEGGRQYRREGERSPDNDWAHWGERYSDPFRKSVATKQGFFVPPRTPNPEMDATHLYHQFQAPKRYPRAKDPNARSYPVTVPGEALLPKPVMEHDGDMVKEVPDETPEYRNAPYVPYYDSQRIAEEVAANRDYMRWMAPPQPTDYDADDYFHKLQQIRDWDQAQPWWQQQKRIQGGTLRQPQTYLVSPNQAAEEGHHPSQLPLAPYHYSPHEPAYVMPIQGNQGGPRRPRF